MPKQKGIIDAKILQENESTKKCTHTQNKTNQHWAWFGPVQIYKYVYKIFENTHILFQDIIAIYCVALTLPWTWLDLANLPLKFGKNRVNNS